MARLVLSAFIGIAPEHKLRVIAPDVGGGFGSKIFIYAEETVCLWAARKVGRPVKWTADRSEAFLADAHGRDHVTTAELALDGDGKILALRAKTKANLGAYLSTFASSVPTYLYAPLLSGQYDIPAIYCEVDGVYTNTAPVDAYRGAGRPEATFVVERLVEVAARADRARTRPSSAARTSSPRSRTRRRSSWPTTPATTTPAMRQGAGAGRLRRPRRPQGGERQEGHEARHRLLRLHRGLRHRAERGGRLARRRRRPVGIRRGARQPDRLRRGADRLAQPRPGARDHLRPARLAALGIPIEQVTVVHGDTDKVQFGMGTYGSRSGAVGMSAIYYAIDKVIVKAKKVAGFVLEVPRETVDFNDGIFSSTATNKTLTFPEVALQAYIAHKFTGAQLEPGLKEGAFFDPDQLHLPVGRAHLRGRDRSRNRAPPASTAGPRSTTSARSSTR